MVYYYLSVSKPKFIVLQHDNYISMHEYCHIQAVVVITIIVMVVCGLFFC